MMDFSSSKGNTVLHYKPKISTSKMCKGKEDDGGVDALTWDSLSGSECRTWWQSNQDEHVLKVVFRHTNIQSFATSIL